MRGGAVRRRSPQDGGGWGRGAGERNRDRRGKTRGTEGGGGGVDTTEATETMVTAAARRGQSYDRGCSVRQGRHQ